LLGNGQAVSGRKLVLTIKSLKQKQPSAAFFTPPDSQKLLALLETFRPLADRPCHRCAALRQTTPKAANDRASGGRRSPHGRPWWPYEHGNRDDACEQA